jgi:uncharacterized protein YdeI (YjbR/CyaY-like superfamily)
VEHDGIGVIHPLTRAEWRAWLEANHASVERVWLASWAKETGKPRLEYDDLVEEALCFGWVDSRAGRLPDGRTILLLTPRNPKSGWSRTNKVRIERLRRDGLLAAAGRAAVEEAKRNGSWTLLDRAEALELPDDLAAALTANAEAKRNYDEFPPGAKKAIIAWVDTAKRPETRAKRIAETVRLAARNIRANS